MVNCQVQLAIIMTVAEITRRGTYRDSLERACVGVSQMTAVWRDYETLRLGILSVGLRMGKKDEHL